jgi:HlyD family secretion protein
MTKSECRMNDEIRMSKRPTADEPNSAPHVSASLVSNLRASVALCLITLLLGGVAGCNRPTAAETPQAEGPQGSVVRVAAAKPKRQTISVSTVQPARIEPFEVTPLYPKITGYVDSINVDIGDPVEPGSVLLSIAAPEMHHELAQKTALVGQAEAEIAQADAAVEAAKAGVTTAAARVKEAEAGLERARGEFQMWQDQHQRTTELAERGSISTKLLDESRSQLSAATATLHEAEARIESATAALAESRANQKKVEADGTAARARLRVAQADRDRMQSLVDYGKITAPFPGIVTRRHVDPGHFVQPANSGGAKPLLVVARRDKLRVSVEIPEGEAALVDRGDRVRLRIPALNGLQVDGTIARTSWALEPANRTLRAEIDLDNVDGPLRPGMYATIHIDLAEQADALVLPAAALVYEGGQAFCCVVEKKQIARRAVTTGLRSGDQVEILSGLAGDEVVVQARAESLSEGQPVELLPPAGS